MTDHVKIYFKDVRPVLDHASRKQAAALFLAILDYAEKGQQPKKKAEDPFSAWLLSVFPLFKARIDGEGGGEP